MKPQLRNQNYFWKIIVFVIITLVMTMLLGMIQQFSHLPYTIITLPQLAPAFAAMITMMIYKDLKIKLNFQINQKFKNIVSVFGIPLIILATVSWIGKMIGIEIKPSTIKISSYPLYFLGILIGSIGEEIGWRGFLQPTFEKKHTKIIASILVGTIWGLWHVGHIQKGILFLIGFYLFTIASSILIAFIYEKSNYNIWLASIFHFFINLGFFLFFGDGTNIKLMIVNGIVWGIIALLTIIIKKKFPN